MALVDLLVDGGAGKINFVGGEPTLLPDLGALCERVKTGSEGRCAVSLVTNVAVARPIHAMTALRPRMRHQLHAVGDTGPFTEPKRVRSVRLEHAEQAAIRRRPQGTAVKLRPRKRSRTGYLVCGRNGIGAGS